MPNVLMVIPGSLYRQLPVEFRAQLVETASLIAIGERPDLWRIDKTPDPSVPDHLDGGELGTVLKTGVT